LCGDGTVDSAGKIFCMICHKSFAYHGLNTAWFIVYSAHVCGKLTK